MQKITVLSGGMGGATFVRGLLHGIRTGALPGVAPDAEVTVVANTADDLWVHGLKVCPDLDTVMYTLGDGIDPESRVGTPGRDVEHQGRSSRRTAWSRRGSASATATSRPTSSGPRCSTRATRSPR